MGAEVPTWLMSIWVLRLLLLYLILVCWGLLFKFKMTDLNMIRVIPFCGKVDDWPIWNEKFLAKTKRFVFKDLLLGKLSIPEADEEIDEDS